MFRLLAILLALNSSFEIDCAPRNVVEGGKKIAENNINQPDLILDENEANSRRASGSPEEAQFEREIGTFGTDPSLKPRTLEDSEGLGKRSPSLGERLRKKARTVKGAIKTKAGRVAKRARSNESRRDSTWDDQGQRTRGKKRARVAPTEDLTETIDAEENDNNATTSSQAHSPKINQALNIEKETAVGLIKAVGIILLNPNANPYKSRNLAELIDSAFYMYFFTYDRPVPKLDDSDETSRMAGKLAVLAEILQELGASEESEKASQLSLSSGKRLSKALQRALSPGSYDLKPLDKSENAITLVRAVKFLLAQDNGDGRKANPHKDEKLAQLVDAAVYAYNDANSLAQLTFEEDEDPKYILDAKVAELRLILDEVAAKDRKKWQLEYRPGQDDEGSSTLVMPPPIAEEGPSTFEVMRGPKVEAQNLVSAVREALDDPNASPYTDEKLAELIDDAIEKYRKAYNRRKLHLQGLDERTQMERKLKELHSIFEDMDKRNAELGNLIVDLTTQLRRRGHNI